MTTLSLFVTDLFIFAFVTSVLIVIVGRVIRNSGKPECRKCEEYDNDIEYCWYTHDCHDCHRHCNNFKRKRL